MNKRRIKYNFINILVILISSAVFILNFSTIGGLLVSISPLQLLTIIATVILVHSIKATRLYFAIYGSDISLFTYLKTYCKVTPVSVILPYKIGELFRIYCYGKTIKDFFKGLVIVLLDRFMDTAGLVTVILLFAGFAGVGITPLVYIFVIFLAVLLLAVAIYPGLYRFWKQYILRARATKRKISALKFLETVNKGYVEIQEVTKGRGVILYVLSLLAWLLEIGSVMLQTNVWENVKSNQNINEYLSAAMGSSSSKEMELFVFFSVLLMIVVYLCLKAKDVSTKRRGAK